MPSAAWFRRGRAAAAGALPEGRMAAMTVNEPRGRVVYKVSFAVVVKRLILSAGSGMARRSIGYSQ